MKCERCSSSDVKLCHWNETVTTTDLSGAMVSKHFLPPPKNPHEAMLKLGFTALSWGAKFAFSKVYQCKACDHRFRVWF
jgi:hypothetical protein